MPFSLNMLPVNSDLVPKEGPIIAQANINWGPYPNTQDNPSGWAPDNQGNYFVDINLQSQAQTGRFTRCQAVWIDNSTNGNPIQIISQESSQQIFVGAFSQGMYQIFANQSPNFRVTLMLAIANWADPAVYSAGSYPPMGSTQFLFFNAPQKPFEKNLVSLPNPQPGYNVFNTGYKVASLSPAITALFTNNNAWCAKYALILFRIDITGYYLSVGASTATPFFFNILTMGAKNLLYQGLFLSPAFAAASAQAFNFSVVYASPLIVPPVNNSGTNNSDNIGYNITATIPNTTLQISGQFNYMVLPVE